MTTSTKPKTREITDEGDFIQIKSIDHVHFYVGNTKRNYSAVTKLK